MMIDAGLFDPVIVFIIRFAKGDPLKITLGTAILTMLVHLDRDGTVTALCVVLKFTKNISMLTALAKHRQLADVCFIRVQIKRFAENTEKARRQLVQDFELIKHVRCKKYHPGTRNL